MKESMERRREARIGLRQPLMASAELIGTCFPAELVDLSESGAKFNFPECYAQIEIKAGCETELTVCLLSGKLARFKAEARWFHRFADGYVIGVKFLETIKDTLFREMLQSTPLPA